MLVSGLRGFSQSAIVQAKFRRLNFPHILAGSLPIGQSARGQLLIRFSRLAVTEVCWHLRKVKRSLRALIPRLRVGNDPHYRAAGGKMGSHRHGPGGRLHKA